MYDCEWLAQFNRNWYVLGVDISAEAIARCSKASTAPNCHFKLANFFDFQNSQQSDLVFDYTFFCAIDPQLRRAWAQKMGEIVREGGYLLCLMYPLKESVGNSGPPFAVSDEAYVGALSGAFCVQWRSGREAVPVNERRKDRFLLQELILFKRK